MNDVSLTMVDYINLFLPSGHELKCDFNNGFIAEWYSDLGLGLRRNVNGNYVLIKDKRLVEFTPECVDLMGDDVRHYVIISLLADVGYRIQGTIKGVATHQGVVIYVLDERESYGGTIVCDYKTTKDLVLNGNVDKYMLGMTYKERLGNVWIQKD